MKAAIRALFQEIGNCLVILLGVWLLVGLYAVVHDQYIVRIAPEHFTLHHQGFNEVRSAELQAFLYAAFASVGPGILYGTTLAIVCRMGRLQPFSALRAYRAVIVVILIAEVASLCTGLFVYCSGHPLYPVRWYPDVTLELYVTRSMQISCYFAAAMGAAVTILLIPFIRMNDCGKV